MAIWLYQMTANDEEPWYPENYRLDVWEGKGVTWPAGKITPREEGEIAAGDRIVFFFSKTGISDPGIYGWGIVTQFIKGKSRNQVRFAATPPSDFLKMSPCWDEEVEALMDDIRGKMKQGTVWGMTLEEFNRLRKKIHAHLGPGSVIRTT